MDFEVVSCLSLNVHVAIIRRRKCWMLRALVVCIICTLCILSFTMRLLKDYTNLNHQPQKGLIRGSSSSTYLGLISNRRSPSLHCGDVNSSRLVALHQQCNRLDVTLISTQIPGGLSSHPREGKSGVSSYEKKSWIQTLLMWLCSLPTPPQFCCSRAFKTDM